MKNIRKSDSLSLVCDVVCASKPAVTAQKKRSLRGRRLVLVDLENVVGGAHMTVEQAGCAQQLISDALCLTSKEQVIVGIGPTALLSAGICWPGSRTVMGRGQDGADLALLDVLSAERVEERFDEVVLVSGDGIFSEAVAALGAHGIVVTVVSLVGSCSKRLRMAASSTLFIEPVAAELREVA